MLCFSPAMTADIAGRSTRFAEDEDVVTMISVEIGFEKDGQLKLP